MQVFYLGRALRTKETLPDFMKWRRVTQYPLVFCGLMGSQRTPGFGASHVQLLLCNQSFIYDKQTNHKKMCLNFHIHLYLIAYNF